MKQEFSICDADGRIIHVGHSEMALRQEIPEGGRMVMSQVDHNLKYIDPDSGDVMDKTPINVTVNGKRVTGLPRGTTVIVDGKKIVAVDGEVMIDPQYSGEYDVVIDSPRHLVTTVRYVKP